MRRSGWITGVVVMQAFWALALVALPIYLLVLARSRAIVAGPSGAEAASGLKIAAAVFVLPTLLAIASFYGLWKDKLWGWWLALVSNTLMLAMFVYSMVDDGSVDWDMLALTVISAILPILLLTPVVRKFYWGAAVSLPPQQPAEANL